jgi:rod shape-determining protein MreB
MASALGIGLDVEAPKGNMVVDIGGGTTEIAVISLGGIVVQDSIKVAGDVFTNDIQQYLRQQHNIKVGQITAEKLKIAIGAVLPNLETEEEPEPSQITGPNIMTAHPVKATITYQEIAHCLDKSVARIEAGILHVLEQTPPELYSDIVENGIHLAGGGSLLRGLAKRLSDKVNIPFYVAEDPLRAVARGTCMALKNTENYTFLMR